MNTGGNAAPVTFIPLLTQMLGRSGSSRGSIQPLGDTASLSAAIVPE